MGEDDFDCGVRVFVGNDNLATNGSCEALFAVRIESRPKRRKVARFLSDSFDRKVADGEGGVFAFKLRELGAELGEPFGKRCVEFLELLNADAASDVKVVELFHLRSDAFALSTDARRALVVFRHFGFRPIEVGRDLASVGEILGDTGREDFFQHCRANLIFALRAGVIGAARIDIHFAAAAAFEQSGEDMRWFLAGFADRLGLLLKDCGNAVKRFGADNGGTFRGAPFAFGLRFFLPSAGGRDTEKIRAIETFGA